MIYKIKDVILLFFALLMFIATLAGGGWYAFIWMVILLFFSKKLWGKYLASVIYKNIIGGKMNSNNESEAVFHYNKKIYINGKYIIGSQFLDYFDIYPRNIAKWTYDNMDNRKYHHFYELTHTDYNDRERSIYIIINEKTKVELEKEKLRNAELIKHRIYNGSMRIKVKEQCIYYEYASQID